MIKKKRSDSDFCINRSKQFPCPSNAPAFEIRRTKNRIRWITFSPVPGDYRMVSDMRTNQPSCLILYNLPSVNPSCLFACHDKRNKEVPVALSPSSSSFIPQRRLNHQPDGRAVTALLFSLFLRVRRVNYLFDNVAISILD